ncbi:hypothetical protein V6N13_029036 [Hibiscus sabdariffa]|uniref:Uncharacterized protein n=2 Tax=Hibiscus sabdariffa TaxID=183260 RepID=A0ABR2TB38_9ROSI
MSTDQDKTTVSPIQQIIDRISHLCNLTAEYASKADTPPQTTGDTNSAADDQTENPQDGSASASRGSSGEANKQDGDDGKGPPKTESGKKGKDGSSDGGFSKTDALHELGKLYKELDYMYRSFEKLDKFQKDLSDPLKTLEANVNDIVADLKKEDLPKQVQHNLRVLRNNIIRVKILLPSQHQATGLSSEGNRGLQATVATGVTGDLPHLFGEKLFEESYYFEEIKEKYESLKDDRLKLCLLCFAIFPENAVIKKRFLRFWWVGEKLVEPQGQEEEEEDKNKDENCIVNETLKTYEEKGLIQPVLKKNRLETRSYKIDPIVRSCLIKFAKEARFFDYDTEGKPTMDFSTCYKACMVRSDAEKGRAPWFSKYLKGNDKDKKSEKPKEQQQGQGKTEKQQHGQGKLTADLVKLQMLFNFPNQKTLETASQEFDKLQTLFNLSKQFPGLPKEWLSKMSNLKVLYMGKWESTAGQPRHIEVEDIDFLKGLKKLKNLRLLSLQGVSGIPSIPGTLGKLENLKILDLRACHNLERLPDKMGSLKALTYLDLSECYLLEYVPRKLSELKELQVLKGFVIVDTKKSCTLDDLSKLEKLRKLSINVNTTKFDINAAKDSLVKFKKLGKLRIVWGSRGMPKENPTQNGGKEQPLKSKKHQASSATKEPENKNQASSATEKKNKARDDLIRVVKKVIQENKANSKTTNEEDIEKQNGGVSDQDQRSDVLNKVSMLWKAVTSGGEGKKRRELKGLENLVKLDLQCFPYSAPPEWLVPSKMLNLNNLSIRGGKLSYLEQDPEDKKWKVDTLRLKFLVGFKMNWKEMQVRFPRLKYLENVRSPRITLCPCDENGIWQAPST